MVLSPRAAIDESLQSVFFSKNASKHGELLERGSLTKKNTHGTEQCKKNEEEKPVRPFVCDRAFVCRPKKKTVDTHLFLLSSTAETKKKERTEMKIFVGKEKWCLPSCNTGQGVHCARECSDNTSVHVRKQNKKALGEIESRCSLFVRVGSEKTREIQRGETGG